LTTVIEHFNSWLSALFAQSATAIDHTVDNLSCDGHSVAAVVKGRKSVYRKLRKSKKRVSYIKPARKQITLLFPNVIKWTMNYYDKMFII